MSYPETPAFTARCGFPARADGGGVKARIVLLAALGTTPVAGTLAANQTSGPADGHAKGPEPLFPTHSESDRVSLTMVPGRSPLQFHYDWPAQELLVYRPGSVEPAQILRPDTTEPPPSGSGLSAIDYDGDGDLDLRVVDWWGTGGVGYEVFLYDGDTGLFEHSLLYSALANPQPDGTGCVTSGGSAGHAGNIYSVGYYCPEGQQMRARWLDRQSWDDARQHYVFSRKEWDDAGQLRRRITEHRRASSVLWAEELIWSDDEGCYTTMISEVREGVRVESHGAPICHAID